MGPLCETAVGLVIICVRELDLSLTYLCRNDALFGITSLRLTQERIKNRLYILVGPIVTRPHSCAKPRQPTLHAEKGKQ